MAILISILSICSILSSLVFYFNKIVNKFSQCSSAGASNTEAKMKTSARKHVAAVLLHIAARSRYCSLLCRHTLTFVLRGEWPKLAPNVAKTHLYVTLQRCVSQLGQQHPAASRCSTLLALVNNPWTNPILTNILNGQSDSEHEEGKKR